MTLPTTQGGAMAMYLRDLAKRGPELLAMAALIEANNAQNWAEVFRDTSTTVLAAYAASAMLCAPDESGAVLAGITMNIAVQKALLERSAAMEGTAS